MKLDKKTVQGKQVKFVIFAKLPSYHELTAGKDWKVRSGIKRKFMSTFFWAIKEGLHLARFRYIGNTSYFKGKVLVHLTIFGKWRGPPDRDNYIQSAGKLIIDQFFSTNTRHAVVNLLPDDRFVEWGKVKFERGRPMIEVTIEEIK